MTPKTLPPYFKDYLDERFNHVIENIEGVKTEVVEVKVEVKRINGTLIETASCLTEQTKRNKMMTDLYIPQFKTTQAEVGKINTKFIRIVFIMFALGIFWIKESRDFIVNMLIGLISGG